MLVGIVAIAIAIAFLADQISKYWLDGYITTGEVISFGDYFSLVKVWNTGVSFSMFNNYGNFGRIALCLLSLAVCVFLLYWMFQEKNKIKIISLGLIIGGALGNVADRIRFGAVLDFLDFHIADHHWPAFNLADSFICIGAGVLIMLELFYGQRKGKEQK